MSRRDRIWVPIDVHFWDSPQVARSGVLAGVLYQRLLCYSMTYHTDGLVPVECVEAMPQGDQLPALLRVELIAMDGDDVRILDWEKWHKIAAARAAKLEADRVRIAEKRRAAKDAISVEVQEEQVQDIDIATSRDIDTDSRTTVARHRDDSASTFAEFWASYPLKVGKRAAQSAYLKALKRADAPTILAGLVRVRPSWDPRYTPHATTWLNRDGWEDDPAPASGPVASVIGLVQAAHNYDAGARFF